VIRFPHDTLWQLFALSNGNVIPNDQRGNKQYQVDKEKIEAAQFILDRVQQISSKHRTLVDQMQILIDWYIELAFYDAKSFRKSRALISLPGSSLTRQALRVNTFSHVRMPTRSCNPLMDGTRDMVTINNFDRGFRLVGGLNLPKLVVAVGSDGRRYKQLVKGKDDLRQDAVMQQIFELVDALLAQKFETRKRKLHIRTYRCIPLTPCAGLLEWVDQTTPIGEYLLGSSNQRLSAHHRFRPKDWLPSKCRKMLSEATEANRHEVYAEICKMFQPVFHHFFVESFPDPRDWFERRLTYTRSVASNSIVGYIVGLGDRHAQNILIDEKTAELVHIDLGVAFEQGKMLHMPELVPFRLTRLYC